MHRSMKRLIDVIGALVGLCLLSPILIIFMLAVWLQDFHSPLYIAARIGRNGKRFRMVKLRSMTERAGSAGIQSTAADDPRITRLGHVIRAFKLDELTQLWNVFVGDMSLVGPRPNVPEGVACYTDEERRLLDVRPGITDFSSIVFSDEGKILEGSDDPDQSYDQLIRPGKSRLGLFYVDHQSLWLDIVLIVLTIVAIINRDAALRRLQQLLKHLGATEELIVVAGRKAPLIPGYPPGFRVVSRGRNVETA